MDSLRAELIHDKSAIVPVMVQMPALNTRQFDWCKSKLPNKAEPVPPIYHTGNGERLPFGQPEEIGVSFLPTLFGKEPRHVQGEFLCHRSSAAALTLVGMASLSVIALYQLGIFKRLPEPSLPILDAEKVNGSPEAYQLLNTPDAVLGLGSYAATLGLVAIGGANRAQSKPWIPLALAAKSGLDSLLAAVLTRKSWTHFRAFSLYNLVTALCSFLIFPLILPEAKAAWRKLCVSELNSNSQLDRNRNV
jgi:hypothetical protein